MLFGPQRGSAFTIFNNFARTFGLTIVVILLALIFRDTRALMENGAVLAVALVTPVARFLGYLFTYYSIDEEKFHVKSGLFNKKNLELPLDRITTVDFTQNLIFQWLGVYSIKIDNASNYGGNGAGKVQLALKKADALRMKELLLSGKDGSGVYDAKSAAEADRHYVMGKGSQEENIPEADADAGYNRRVFNMAEQSAFEKSTSRKSKTGESVYRMLDGDTYTVPAEESIVAEPGYHDKISVIPIKNILIMGALQSKGNAVAQVISILAVLGGMANIVAGKELGFEDKLLDMILAVPGIGITAILIGAFIVLTTVLGAFFAIIKYYGFKIRDGEKSIYLEYGLFTKKNQSLLKEKISGVEFVQSFPMRLFKVGYLNVFAVGYGDMESREKAMFYPLIKQCEAGSFVSKYIPEIDSPAEEEYEKPLKSSIRYFFLCFRFLFALALAGVTVVMGALFGFVEVCPVNISWIWILLGAILLLAVLSVFMEYRNTGVCTGAKNVHFASGGFTRIKTAVKTSMIESVSDKGSIWKRRKEIVSIKIGILAPEMDSVKAVRNMHLQAFENIKNVIHY